MKLQRRLFALLGIMTGLIFVQACGRELPHEESCNFVQNQNLQRVAWGKNEVIDIYIDSSVPQEHQPAIITAIEAWNAKGRKLRGRDFFRLSGGSPGSSQPAIDNVTKIYMFNTWESHKSTEQARTTIYWSGTRIYEADIRINDKNFDFYSSETPDYSKVHLPSLVSHELGHVLGLAHTGDHDSVMQVSLANGKTRLEPGATDVGALKCEYL